MENPSYQSTRKYELLHSEKYKEFNIYIWDLGTHPTAYLEIPKEHSFYERRYSNIENNNVHGGLTYSERELGEKSNSWFIGWDYAHYGDYTGYSFQSSIYEKMYRTEEILEEAKKYADEISEQATQQEV